ncbi:TPA: hypothetical protein ACH3X1_010031 [Trebouxia sp. C0004]
MAQQVQAIPFHSRTQLEPQAESYAAAFRKMSHEGCGIIYQWADMDAKRKATGVSCNNPLSPSTDFEPSHSQQSKECLALSATRRPCCL